MLEVHSLRRIDDAEVRRHGGEVRGVTRAAPLEGLAGHDAGRRRSFRRRMAEFWEIWPMPVPDGELHRTLYVDGIWAARPCGAYMLQRREDGLLVHGKVGELEGVVDSHGSDPGTRGGLHRRLERVRQGHARDLAAHQSPEVHLPRLLEGQALHDNAAEAPGGARALRHRVRPHGHRHAESGRARG